MKKIKNKWCLAVIIVVITILMFLGIIFICKLIYNSKHAFQVSNNMKMSSSELIEFFENEGYEYEITEFSGQSGIYVTLSNNKNGVVVQRILNTLLGTMMTFRDKTINDSTADLIDYSRNNTIEKEQQYKAYEKWLEKYNISKMQLSEMFDYYYKNNIDKKEKINVNELLNN